jgi:SAM-dependent methyltransferase
MAFSDKDRQSIARFWSERAHLKAGRWTSPDMLQYEENVIEKLFSGCSSLVDLGSGPGLLSRKWVAKNIHRSATCVDFEPKFEQNYLEERRVVFVHSDVVEYRSSQVFDCATAFGLVTYLDAAQELRFYENLQNLLRPGGVAVVKNSVSIGDTEKVFRGYSTSLGSEYVGRYPATKEQLGRLASYFSEVEIVPYPKDFKRFEDTEDLMFVCKN